MQSLASDIADLLAVAEVAGHDAGDPTSPAIEERAERLEAFEPSLLLLADADGKVIAADDLGSGMGPDMAAPLAVNLAAQLAGKETCKLEVPTEMGTRLAFAVHLPDHGRREILACLVRPFGLPEKRLDEIHAALVVCSAFAWAAIHKRSGPITFNTATLHKRIEHLLAEHDTLRASHAEAVTAAIEEREERLREQQEHVARIQAVMMMAADGIVTIDENGVIESFNEAAGWIFGYPPEKVIGRNISMLMPSPHREQHDEYLAEYMQAGVTGVFNYPREATGQRKDGTTFPLELAVSEVSIGERRIFTGIVRDITERRKAEEELKRLHLQNEMILNSAGEGIFGLDRNGSATFVNPAAARMLGYEREELIGRLGHEIIHHTKLDGTPYPWKECPVHRTLQDGTVLHASSEAFWRKDGTSFPIEYTTTPIREGDKIVGAVVTFQDITERRMLEAQLRQAQKLESIGQLAAGIAHEINTPTQYIGDNTRFLEEAFRELSTLLASYNRLLEVANDDGKGEEVVAEVLAAAEQADAEYLIEEIPKAIRQSLEGVERVAKIIRSMKEFSHPGGDKMQAIDLNRAIESTLTVSRNEWKYVADMVTDFDPNLPMATCLPSDFNQVILNLVVNAAHAIADKVGGGSTEKGTITITTRCHGDWLEIRVTDTGTGIPERIRAKVFDPFFTTKEVGKGTGQGLAIVHSVVTEKHGGTISFETEDGRGTTFIVRIPIRQESSSPSSDYTESRLNEAGGNMR